MGLNPWHRFKRRIKKSLGMKNPSSAIAASGTGVAPATAQNVLMPPSATITKGEARKIPYIGLTPYLKSESSCFACPL